MENKFCSECGRQLTSEDRFCPECGEGVSENNEPMFEDVELQIPPPPPVDKSNHYIPPKATDSSEYNTIPIEKNVQEDYSYTEKSFQALDKSYNSYEADKIKEFDPFNQNADAKTTAYEGHTTKIRNILLLFIVLFFLLVGLIFVVFLFRK
jgi:hypothetical protein